MRKLFVFTFGVLSVGVSYGQFTPGIEYTNQPGLAAINVLPAYNLGYSGNGVRIGIVDTGINPNHVEFRNAIVAGYDSLSGQSSTSDFSFLTNYQPNIGHGSHVAGIAAARLDRDATRPLNMMGVAYNANLIIAAWSDDTSQSKDEYDSQISKSLNYATSQRARVINNSWGLQEVSNPTQGYNEYVKDFPLVVTAIRNALNNNAVLVFAAGNETDTNARAPSTTPSFDAEIARLGGWITVVATTNRGIDPATNQPEMARALHDGKIVYTNYCGITKNYCISAPGGLVGAEDDPVGTMSFPRNFVFQVNG